MEPVDPSTSTRRRVMVGEYSRRGLWYHSYGSVQNAAPLPFLFCQVFRSMNEANLDHTSPAVTEKTPVVGVVASVVIVEKQDVLLVRGAEGGHMSGWRLPWVLYQGDQPIETATIQGVREQTGLIVRLTDLFDVITHGVADPLTVEIVYGAEEMDGELCPTEFSSEVAWHPLNDLPDLSDRRRYGPFFKRLLDGNGKHWS